MGEDNYLAGFMRFEIEFVKTYMTEIDTKLRLNISLFLLFLPLLFKKNTLNNYFKVRVICVLKYDQVGSFINNIFFKPNVNHTKFFSSSCCDFTISLGWY